MNKEIRNDYQKIVTTNEQGKAVAWTASTMQTGANPKLDRLNNLGINIEVPIFF